MKLREYQQDLISRTFKAMREGAMSPCIVLPCGGGKSIITADIAKQGTDCGKRILFLVHRKELCEQIESTFRRYGVDMKLVDIMMVQTACRRLAKMPKYQLIITDEGHHGKANTYQKIYDYYKDTKRIFVTATPIRLGGKTLNNVCDDLIVGPSVQELIGMNCLSPYKYFAPQLQNFLKTHRKNGDYDTKEVFIQLDNKGIYGDVVKHYKKLADGKQAICYCVNIVHSEKMAEIFLQNGINAASISSNTSKITRTQIIEDFRRGIIKILCNANLISEGFDVPNCEVAILLRPTLSLSLYLQQAMRCMRYKPNKIAIIIDHVGNIMRHGFPDDDREWSLEEKTNLRKNVDLPMRTCPNCYAIVPASTVRCPNCGEEFQTPRYKIEEYKGEELKEITRENKKQINHIVMQNKSIYECNSLSEMYEWCKVNGKKPGYAWHVWNSKSDNYNISTRK